jgi:hypothetical protein
MKAKARKARQKAEAAAAAVKKGHFCAIVMLKRHLFTKTGSGQT